MNRLVIYDDKVGKKYGEVEDGEDFYEKIFSGSEQIGLVKVLRFAGKESRTFSVGLIGKWMGIFTFWVKILKLNQIYLKRSVP